MFGRNGGDARWKGRREERGLALFRRGVENRFQIFGEAHVEHFVGFIQHHHADALEIERTSANVVERSPRRGHGHVDPALERSDLGLHRCAAVNGEGDDAHLLAVAVYRFGYLHGELARGDEHEGCGSFARRGARGQLVEEGKGEGGRLAGAGGRLRQHVAPGEERRNGGELNGRRFFIAERSERGEESGIQAKRGKVGDGRLVARGRGRYCSWSHAAR